MREKRSGIGLENETQDNANIRIPKHSRRDYEEETKIMIQKELRK